jgi:RNA polymerase subunit RPABC4/transcription elongation factor Spt4
MKIEDMNVCTQCNEVFPQKRTAECPACGSKRIAPVAGWVTSFTVQNAEALEAYEQARMGNMPNGVDVIVDLAAAIGQ